MSTNTREERLARRVADLHHTDPQFAQALPKEEISHAIEPRDIRLPALMQAVLDGYAERPALGQRAVHLVEDPGRAAPPPNYCHTSTPSPTPRSPTESTRSRTR